jgi:hypothetical protein
MAFMSRRPVQASDSGHACVLEGECGVVLDGADSVSFYTAMEGIWVELVTGSTALCLNLFQHHVV